MTAAQKLKMVEEDPKLKDGDGGGEDNGIQNISIRPVSNGFLVNFTYDDGEEVEEVHHTVEDLIDSVSLELAQ